MFGEIFKAILITTLAGSAMTAVICILHPVTKRIFGCTWHYYIWLCVLFTMLVPVKFNIKSEITVPRVKDVQQIQSWQKISADQPVMTDAAVKSDKAIYHFAESAGNVWNGIINNSVGSLAYLWLGGTVLLILINTVGYIRLCAKLHKNAKSISCPKLRECTAKGINVKVWKNTASPFTIGIFKPTLVLPDKELSDEQLDNILRHELIHFKRHDILYKLFAEAVKCVHWFNPIAWYVSNQIAAECEISCDTLATKNMSGDEKISYINTILSLLPTGKSKQIPLTTEMASGKKTLKRRFLMIKNKKTTSRLVSVISVAAAFFILSGAVLASGLLSGCTSRNDENNKIDELTYNSSDKNVKITDENLKTSEPEADSSESETGDEVNYGSDITDPKTTVGEFFKAFEAGDFEQMKKYCTQSCTDTYFKENSVFGMTWASLTGIRINPAEYAKSSNGFNILVSVDMTPHKDSVYDPSETSAAFYVVLMRQNDGRYLIDSFMNGIGSNESLITVNDSVIDS